MTQYFEVHERDGAARLGEFRLAEPIATPALVDDRLEDAGSLWSADRELPAGDGGPDGAGGENALTILPHRGLPAGTDEEVQESFPRTILRSNT